MEEIKKVLINVYDAVPKKQEDIKAISEEVEKKLNESGLGFAKIEDALGIKKLNIFIAIFSLNAVLLLAGMVYKPLGIIMTRFTCFVYPAYASFKAIELDEKNDDTQWLTYWFIFAIFTMAEETILKSFERFLPFYFIFKLFFCFWCCMPQTRGAETLYTFVVRNLIHAQQPHEKAE